MPFILTNVLLFYALFFELNRLSVVLEMLTADPEVFFCVSGDPRA